MKLQIEHLHFSYDDRKIIEDIHLHVDQGQFVGIIGPNGSGKSTVLKNVYRALQPTAGAILLDGEDLLTLNNKKAAGKMGVVGQENAIPFDFKVEEIVAMGRSPHKKLFEGDSETDKQIIQEALSQVDMESMAKRSYMNLSGGEKQRVILARVLAQQTDFLLLDEPTNHLDIYYQLQMFDFLKHLRITVLSAFHDLNMAALYCNRLYVLKDGRLYQSGTPEEVLTPEMIREVYNVNANVTIHPATKKVSVTYLPGIQ